MIGIDIGGANLKVVDDAGVHIHYRPLWQGARSLIFSNPMRDLPPW